MGRGWGRWFCFRSELHDDCGSLKRGIGGGPKQHDAKERDGCRPKPRKEAGNSERDKTQRKIGRLTSIPAAAAFFARHFFFGKTGEGVIRAGTNCGVKRSFGRYSPPNYTELRG